MSYLKEIAKKIPPLRSAYHAVSNRLAALNMKSKNAEQIFTKIYEKNGFGGKESISGPGSDERQTSVIRHELPKLFKRHEISTLLDIPCGDFFWMKHVDLTGVNYIGADIVEALIKDNIEKHGKDTLEFQKIDLLNDPIPEVDLILCRDCLVHFSNDDIFRAIKSIRKSQSKYLLTTTFTARKFNSNIITGQWRPLNLEAEPFNLPKPIFLINENCTESAGSYNDKSLGLWKISSIPQISN
jgi:hypothetical protein